MQSLIELKNISKAFGDTTVLDNFNLSVNENEFITLLGPSGCGKTFLRARTLQILRQIRDISILYFRSMLCFHI